MGARGAVWDRLPAGGFLDGTCRENKDPGQSSVPVAGEQHLLRLPLQSGHGNLPMALGAGGADGGIHPAKVHIRRQDKGHTLKYGVPFGDI